MKRPGSISLGPWPTESHTLLVDNRETRPRYSANPGVTGNDMFWMSVCRQTQALFWMGGGRGSRSHLDPGAVKVQHLRPHSLYAAHNLLLMAH